MLIMGGRREIFTTQLARGKRLFHRVNEGDWVIGKHNERLCNARYVIHVVGNVVVL